MVGVVRTRSAGDTPPAAAHAGGAGASAGFHPPCLTDVWSQTLGALAIPHAGRLRPFGVMGTAEVGRLARGARDGGIVWRVAKHRGGVVAGSAAGGAAAAKRGGAPAGEADCPLICRL